MKVDLKKIFSWLVGILIIIAPSNLFLVLNQSAGYVNGLRIDYLIPKFYLIDAVVVVTIAVGAALLNQGQKREFQNIFFNQKNRLLFFCLTMLIVAQFFSSQSLIGMLTTIKIAAFSSLSWLLLVHKKLVVTEIIQLSLIISIAVQLCFAIGQSLTQHSLAPYWLSGESKLTSSMIGLARGTFNGEERLLAYGTTAHPNILAGVMVLFSLALITSLRNKNSGAVGLSLIPALLIIFLTQSVTALLALVIGLAIWLLQKYRPKFQKNLMIFGLLLVIINPWLLQLLSTGFNSTSIERRVYLNQAAVQILMKRPITGVGLGNFTGVLETYSTNPEFVRFIQPAHNVFWLLAAETGLIGMMILAILGKKLLNQPPSPLLLALIPLLAFDHYLLTVESGLLALVLFPFVIQPTPSSKAKVPLKGRSR
ncbi:MAG: hypothetical protein COU66_00840 [Candidatus Pacebacteria bacterium CG10_big_fil_rev_8_21_14_0_10_44_11]|nr:MAG: hypothetical protein COU66_00840 [Candidatus Pacebacteria bacterium CG10_big_fil_rev_8_21_14_0_10_44_11]